MGYFNFFVGTNQGFVEHFHGLKNVFDPEYIVQWYTRGHCFFFSENVLKATLLGWNLRSPSDGLEKLSWILVYHRPTCFKVILLVSTHWKYQQDGLKNV